MSKVIASTIQTSKIQNSSGVEQYPCKAWVNFNGTETVAIRTSGNVSSIIDNGTGDWTINFTTSMDDANYVAVFGSGSRTAGVGAYVTEQNDSPLRTTSQLRLYATKDGCNLRDETVISIAIFR